MLDALWAQFQRLPPWVRIFVWLAVPPVPVAVAAARSQKGWRSQVAVGGLFFCATAAIWIAIISDESPESPPEVVRGTGEVAEQASESASANTFPTAPDAPTVDSANSVPPDEEILSQPQVGDDDTLSESENAQSGTAAEVEGAAGATDRTPAAGSADAPSESTRAPPEPASGTGGTLVADLLATLPVQTEQRSGYDRDLFAGWIDADGNGCDTREEVLIAESQIPATTGSGCRVVAGQWYSYFDAVWVTDSSDLDIDHLVPLAEAWDSGAHSWDSATRRRFSNDLGDSRALIAVTASSNRSKSDRDPAEWLPPDRSYHCAYVADWVVVKHRWQLSVDSAERTAIQRVISGCGTLTAAASSQQTPAFAPAPTPAPTPSPSPAPAPAPAPDASTCVNINTASVDELQAIIHIGPARAEAMIGLRPFSSVNAMERISGIGPTRLADIKSQGLACVN